MRDSEFSDVTDLRGIGIGVWCQERSFLVPKISKEEEEF
jgi:hypothetical protein